MSDHDPDFQGITVTNINRLWIGESSFGEHSPMVIETVSFANTAQIGKCSQCLIYFLSVIMINYYQNALSGLILLKIPYLMD